MTAINTLTKSMLPVLCALAAFIVVFLTIVSYKMQAKIDWTISLGVTSDIERQFSRVRTSLERHLCLIIIAGSETNVSSAPLVLAKLYPNCFVRVVSSQPIEPKLPQDNIFIEPIRLRAHQETFLEPNQRELDDRSQVTASSYISCLESNRVAALIFTVALPEDLDVLDELLRHFPTYSQLRKNNSASFMSIYWPGIEAVIIQGCLDEDRVSESDTSVLLKQLQEKLEIILRKHGYFYSDTFNNVFSSSSASTRCERVFVQPLRLNESTSSWYPRVKLKFASFNKYGRLTNQIIEELSLFDVTKALQRVAVLPQRHTGPGIVTFLYNMSQLEEYYGEPNRVLAFTDVSTISQLGWCNQNCFAIDNAIDCLKSGIDCSAPGCHRLQPTPAMPDSRVSINTEHCSPLLGGIGDVEEQRVGVEFAGDKLFFDVFLKIIDPNRQCTPNHAPICLSFTNPQSAIPFVWPSFSAVILELATTQLEIFKQRITQNRDSAIRILGMHIRLTDYNDAAKSEAWVEAMYQANTLVQQQLNLTSSENAFHGVIICSDSNQDGIVKQAASEFKIPVLVDDCIQSVLTGQNAIDILVRQQLLSEVTCLIGLEASTFSWRIWARRNVQGRFNNCDIFLRNF